MAKILSLAQAVSELIRDGDTVALEGFTHLIPFAAGHEIIRQGRRGLTLVRMTPDIVYDQLIGAGCARKLIFSWGGNPGVGIAAPDAGRGAHRLAGARWNWRSTVTPGWPTATWPGPPGCRSRCCAATRAPTCPQHTSTVSTVVCPFTGERLAAVAALNPDVTVVHAQRADRVGNVQLWGITGVQKEAVLAARRALVTVEELVDELDPQPGAVVLPGWVLDAVAVVPGGAAPSYAHGLLRRGTTPPTGPGTRTSRDREAFTHWLRGLTEQEAA